MSSNFLFYRRSYEDTPKKKNIFEQFSAPIKKKLTHNSETHNVRTPSLKCFVSRDSDMPKRKKENVDFEDDAPKVRETQKSISWRSPLTFSSPQVKFSPNLSFSKSSAKDSNSYNDTFDDNGEKSPLSKNPKYLTINIQCTPKRTKSTPVGSQKNRGTIFPLSDQAYKESPRKDDKENDIEKVDTFSDLCPSSIIDNISIIRNARINKKKMQQQNTSVMDYYSQFMPTDEPISVQQETEMDDQKNNQENDYQCFNSHDQHSYELENSQLSDNLANLDNSQYLCPTQQMQDYNDNVVQNTSFESATQHAFYDQQQCPDYVDLDQNHLNITANNTNQMGYFKQNRFGSNNMFVPNSCDGVQDGNIRFVPQMYQTPRHLVPDNTVHSKNQLGSRMPATCQPMQHHPTLNSLPRIPSTDYDCSQYFQPIDPHNHAVRKPLFQNLKAQNNMLNCGYNRNNLCELDDNLEKFSNLNQSFYNEEVSMAPRIPMNIINPNTHSYPTFYGNLNAPMSNYVYSQDGVNEMQFQGSNVLQNMNQSYYFEPTAHIASTPSVNYSDPNLVFSSEPTVYVKDSITGRILVPQVYQGMNQTYFPEEGLNMPQTMPANQQIFNQPFVVRHQTNQHNGDTCSHRVCQQMWNAKPNVPNQHQPTPVQRMTTQHAALPKVNDKEYLMNKFLNSLEENNSC